MWFSREQRESMFQFHMNKKERDICEFEKLFKKPSCLRSNLSNDDIIS